MIYRTMLEQVKDYREDPALNQSKLKKLLISREAFLKDEPVKPNESMIMGSMIDTLVTGEEGDFDKLFYISQLEKPSDTIESILISVYESAEDKSLGLDAFKDLIEEAVIAFNYYSNLKLETRVNKILDYLGYYEEIKNSYGKTVVSFEQAEKAKAFAFNVINGKYTKDIFKEEEGKSIFYQLPIFWSGLDINKKALLDIVIIKKNSLGYITDVEVYDLKYTSDSVLNFHNSIKKFRYDIQMAWYFEAVVAFFKTEIEKSREKGIKININSSFIVISEDDYPVIVKATNQLISIGLKGSIQEYSKGGRLLTRGLKGIITLLHEYSFYVKNDFEEDCEIFESKGNLFATFDEIMPIPEEYLNKDENKLL